MKRMMIRAYDILTMEQVITCVVTRRNLWSLKRRKMYYFNFLKNGYHKFIKDVYYVPKLRSNILSLEQLVEKGYEIIMKENCLWLKDQNSNLVAKVFMSRNRMFTLSIKTNEAIFLKASIKNEAWC
ncbi:hypothetical protein CR513_59503, partial [Mucuna pruriens]